MSLTLKEFSRDGKVVDLRIYTDGVPKDKIYTIMNWPVTQSAPSAQLPGVTLDQTGMAICSGKIITCGSPDKPNDPIDIITTPIAGEPVRMALISNDGTVKVFAKVVPVPLRGKDHSCTLDVTLLSPGSEIISIEGAGFDPDTELTVTSDSGKEHIVSTKKADAAGHYSMVTLPYVECQIR
jgi:hypothetical protein